MYQDSAAMTSHPMSAARNETIVREDTVDRALGVARDYLSLIKPKILVLLLISTLCPMVLASGGEVSLLALFWALIGGALVSGSASAINCVWDGDIDAIMERTKDRPVPARRIQPASAMLFATLLGIAGLGILLHFLNPMAAVIALCGHLFYVVIYTMWLKRLTPQNIVIGGAAGAFPPVVGWVAVTGTLDWTALYLFLVVFFWTPPHFWALALNKNEDYRRANVPMMPVVRGERTTHLQMLFYSLLLVPVTLLLVIGEKHLGMFSMAVLLGLGLVFAWKNFELVRLEHAPLEKRTEKAWDVFGFSLVYLALFFVCLVVDAVLI
jgi:heme o synthase